MECQRLGDEHLAATQHAAPSAVAAVIRAVQQGKFAPIREPEAADEVLLEALKALVVAARYLKENAASALRHAFRKRRTIFTNFALALEGGHVGAHFGDVGRGALDAPIAPAQQPYGRFLREVRPQFHA